MKKYLVTIDSLEQLESFLSDLYQGAPDNPPGFVALLSCVEAFLEGSEASEAVELLASMQAITDPQQGIIIVSDNLPEILGKPLPDSLGLLLKFMGVKRDQRTQLSREVELGKLLLIVPDDPLPSSIKKSLSKKYTLREIA